MTKRPDSSREPASAKGPMPIGFVVDDDASMQRAHGNLFQSVGLGVELFCSTTETLQRKLPDVANCLVLDIRLPGLSGLDFQAKLTKTNIHIPIIFVIGHGDIPMTIRGERRSGRFPDQTVFAISTCRKPRLWRSNGIANGAKPTRSLRTCNPF